MNDYPTVGRATPLPVVPAFIPLEFATPGLHALQLTAMLRARWRLAAGLLVCGCVFTAALVTWWPRKYTATAVLSVNYAVNDPQQGEELPMGQLGSFIATQMALLQTREVLVRTVRALRLERIPRYREGHRPDRGTLDDWIASRLARGLAVYRAGDGGQLIYVGYTSPSPLEAAMVANTIVNSYRLTEQERVASVPRERLTRQSRHLAALREKVEEAQARVTAFSRHAGLVNPGGAAPTTALIAAEEGLAAATVARRGAEARLAHAVLATTAAAASAPVAALVNQLAQQDAQLAQLQREFTSRHPAIARLAQERETTQQQLETAMLALRRDAEAELRAARQVEQGLESEVRRQRAGLVADSARRDEATQLRLALESAQAVYRQALDGYDAAVFATESGGTNIAVASPATPPVEPAGSGRLRLAALGLFASLLAALGIPLMLELLRRKVRVSEDLERDHGIPVLGEIRPARGGGWR
ncbi:MAG: GumC family protein [Gammaproteobacteria bacterium]